MSFFRRWAALLLFLLVGCAAKPVTEPIQVAHLLPLTGPDKKAAEDAQHGMLLAVEDINAEDKRISGRTINVRNVDARGDPELVQAEAVRLITLNKVVAFVAGPNSRSAERLVRTAQGYSVPVVVPGDFPPNTGLSDFLSLTATPAARGEVLAHYAVKQLKAKRAVVLTDQRHPVAVALAATFVQEWPRASPSSIEELTFRNDTEQIDLASTLTKKKPDVALFAGTPADFLKLQGQLQEMKSSVHLLYGGEDVDAGLFQKPGVTVVTATVFAPQGLTEKGKEFAKRYEERFHEPPGFDAAQAYDAGRLLFDTMQQSKTGRFREELMKRDTFESVTGKVVWKDRTPQRPIFVVRIKTAETELVETISPEEK